MIPQEKSESVTRALRETFGVTAVEDVRPLTKGLSSALVFRIVVQGTPYLLRIIMRKDDPADHYVCMKAAAEAAVAPRVLYANVEDKISITDFIEAAHFSSADAVIRIPAALRTLHALPPFAGRAHHFNTTCMFLINESPALDGFIQQFQAANILPKSECDDLFTWYTQAASTYRRLDPDMVPSHNDLKPENIVFDGQHPWLVDWEAAFQNDRYVDLVMMANFVVTNDIDEERYLREYFERSPNQYQLARYLLMRQIAHMFYTMGYLFLGSTGQPLDDSEPVPEFVDFHRRIWAGEISLESKAMKTVYGRVHWEQLRRNMRQPKFNDVLKTVADQHV